MSEYKLPTFQEYLRSKPQPTRWLLNSAVIPVNGDGEYRYTTIDQQAAERWLRGGDFVSRIGYVENKTFIKRVFGIDVEVNRNPSNMKPGDVALVIRLTYRLHDSSKQHVKVKPEDFTFALMERLS